MTAKLYCFGESGSAYKAALTMTLAGYDWTPVFVDFFGGEARGEAFRRINPMGEVPVLIDGSLILTQSAVIQFHVAERTGRFGGTGEAARREVLRWILWDNHKFSGQIGTTRFLMNFLAADKRPADVIAFQQGRLKAAYRILDDHLSDHEWVADLTPTIADFACASYLFYPEPFGLDRKEWPNLDRWLDRIAGLPGWKHPYDLMPGNPSERAAKA